MPNVNLKDNIYQYNGEKLTYTTLAMRESRLKKEQEKCNKNKECSEFNRLGGEKELKKIENLIHKEQETDYNVKKIGMDTGKENQFISHHQKDRDNANPTAIGGLPKISKGSVNDKIMNNKEVYNEEKIILKNLSSEITKIRYLIEYMNKNDKKN